MASPVSAEFFENGTNKQFEFVLGKYQEALQAKAEGKPGKADSLLKLDKWFQNELPKKIKSRGKESHVTHEELVQTIKWKLARGVFRPRLKDLIQMNTPRVVMQESKKAFRAIFKRNDLEAAVGALSNLKGVGPAMASAVLAAGCPDLAPFMADECLLSLEGSEGIDYTMKEYMKLVAKTQQCVDRLNEQGGSWTPHKVEMAVWTHYVARDLKPELLEDMPSKHEAKVDRFNGACDSPTNGEVSEVAEEAVDAAGEPAKNGVEVAEEVQNGAEEERAEAQFTEEVQNGAEEEREVQNGAEEAAEEEREVQNGAEEAAEPEPEVHYGLDYGAPEVPIEASAGREVPVALPTNGTANGTNGVAHQEADNYGTAYAAEPAAKRPLEEEVGQEPECKRVREEEQHSPEPVELVEPAVVTSPQQAISTGGD